MDDPVVDEFKVFLRPRASVDLIRLPTSVTEKTIALVRQKPNNKMLEVETYHRRPEELHTYKSRIVTGQNVMVVASVNTDKSIYLTRVSESYEFKPAIKKSSSVKSTVPASGPSKQASKAEDASSDEEKVTAITMRFATLHEDEKRKQREASYAFMMEKAEQEEWREFSFAPSDSERGQAMRKDLATLLFR